MLAVLLSLSVSIPGSAELKKDEIIAIVNDQVILRSEINREIKTLSSSKLLKEYAQLTERQVLDKILEKMIIDNLLVQATKRFGISISDIAVENTLRGIAKDKNITINQLRENILNTGQDYQGYVEDLRNSMAVNELYRTQFYSSIRISDDEIENFLKNETAPGSDEVIYDISEFVIIDESKNIGKSTVDEIHNNLSKVGFDQTKKKYMNHKIEINHHGKTKENNLPNIFVASLKNTNANEYTQLIESSRGYHVLKLNEVINRGQIFVNEYKVYHILMVPDVMTTQDEIKEKLFKLRNEIKDINEFIDYAKRYSADKASAIKGGALGWVRTTALVKEFSDVMTKIPVKKISDPFRTRFGWHILYLENKRSVDDTHAQRKKTAEHQLKLNRAQKHREDWVAKLRDQAYIEIKDF